MQAFVAAGQADAYFHTGIHCWDFAAGALLVHEAGGVVADPDGGGDFDLMSRKLNNELVKLSYIAFGASLTQHKRNHIK
jgi:fructose-1,6-bisphosphatase/inositol monophosphatase family enzyme